jgi:hypothetical protein
MQIGITDHAVLRWLERVFELDMEAVRDRIWEVPGLREAAMLGATSFSHGGFVYRMDGGRIVTIEPGDSPQAATRGAFQFKSGRSPKMKGFGAYRPRKKAGEHYPSRRSARHPRHVQEGDE